MVCKWWNRIIIPHTTVCSTCNKIIKMYDTELWFTYPDDNICHGYYDENADYYSSLKKILQRKNILHLIPRLSSGLYLAAIKFGAKYILQINQYELLCIEFVKRNPGCLEWVYNQTELICIEAVKAGDYSLEHVRIKTREICLWSVKKSGYSLRWVEEFQDEEICLEAISNSPYMLDTVKVQTEAICLKAVELDGGNYQKSKHKPKPFVSKLLARTLGL